MNKEQILDMIEITYSRIMRLHFNWRFISTMVGEMALKEYLDKVVSAKNTKKK